VITKHPVVDTLKTCCARCKTRPTEAGYGIAERTIIDPTELFTIYATDKGASIVIRKGCQEFADLRVKDFFEAPIIPRNYWHPDATS